MHGSADAEGTAVLVVDMVNPYEHPGSEELAVSAGAAVPAIAGLLELARGTESPVIYINDNHEDWSTSRDGLIRRALEGARPDLIRPLLPRPDDALLMKMRHSAFFATSLEHVLRELEVERAIIVGQVTEQCVLYTAIDAYMRGLSVAVPRDAVAHIDAVQAEAALDLIASNMDGDCRGVAEAYS